MNRIYDNCPEGTRNNPSAPWNEPEGLELDLPRNDYTTCCGSEEFETVGDKHICGDCKCEAEVSFEDDHKYNLRYMEAERKAIKLREDIGFETWLDALYD